MCAHLGELARSLAEPTTDSEKLHFVVRGVGGRGGYSDSSASKQDTASPSAEDVTQVSPDELSIYHLGQVSLANDRAYNDVNDRPRPILHIRSRKEEIKLALLQQRAIALDNLISTIPASSLDEVVVQLRTALSTARYILDHDWGEVREQNRLNRLAEMLVRITLSALPVVAAAAGADLANMETADISEMRHACFGLEAASASGAQTNG